MKALLHTLFILVFTTSGLFAQSVWVGNIDSDWENPGNWSSGIPTPGSLITIPGTPSGGNFPVFSGSPIINFTIQNAGTITFNSLVYNNGTIINFVGGTIINDGAFFNSGGGNIDNDGFFNNNGQFTNYGTFDSALSGEVNVAAGATFTHAGLFFKCAGPFNSFGTIVNTSNMRMTNVFNNHGTLTNYNSYEAPFGSTFNNFSTATTSNVSGAIFVVNGAFTNDAPIDNQGDLSFQSATIGVNNSTITSNGLLEVAGELTNEGTIISNAELSITDGGTLVNNSVLTNNGTIRLSICGVLVQNGGNAIAAPVLNDGLIYLLNGTVAWTNVEFGNEFTNLNQTKPPVAGCRGGVTATLDANGMASITAAAIDKGSYGSCGASLVSVSIDRTDFTTADLGAQLVTMTIVDDLGVSSTCDAVVLILPYVPPVVPVDDPDVDFACPADITLTGLPGAGNAAATWTEPTATSNCTNGGGSSSNTLYIIAKGDDGRETMKLNIAGQTVKTWNNVGTSFKTFTYIHTAAITADQVRVRFTNDTYDANAGIDYNLVVDKIQLGGATYETEHPTVLGSGVEGNCGTVTYHQKERLNCNGYFQYSNAGASSTSCANAPNTISGFTLIGENGGSKYYVSNQTANWNTARQNCINAGGRLVTISSTAENNYIKNNVAASTIWIGLTDNTVEGTFKWDSGEAVSYTNWLAGEPNDEDPAGYGADYAVLIKSDGKWRDRKETNTYTYVLEIGCVAPTACDNIPNSFSGFTLLGEFGDHKYFASNSAANWTTAQANCAANGGYLVAINNQAENDYIFNVMSTATGSIWTGLNTVSSTGTFKWVNGDPATYFNWEPGEPNGNGINHAARLKEVNGKWTDRSTSDVYDYIMEIPCTSVPPISGDPVVTQIRGPQSGQQFPVGTTEVAYEVTDPCGNQEICTFDVTVESTPSAITLTDCPADLTINTAPGAIKTTVDFGIVTATTTCFSNGLEIKQTQGPKIGDVLRVKDGPQLVAFSVTDSCGNFAACVFTVTAIATPSAITMADCPSDIIAQLNPGETSTTVTWNAPTATTTCFTGNVSVQRLEGPAPGSSFAGGTTTRIIYLVSDECGNTEICIFFVTINACPAAGTACDDGDPKTINDQEDGSCNCAGTLTTIIIECPSDITVEALPGASNAIVQWSDAVATSDCNVGTLNISQIAGPASGSNLPLGTTRITYEAADGCTNTATCSFDITVNATTSTISLQCPADITVAAAPGALTAQVSWTTPDATSDCVIQPVNLIQTAGPANGGSFLEGTTTVSYEATDGCGESVSCSFTVTVNTSCVDADGDGVCAADDCDDNDASIPTASGTACDDGDANTSGDVILADGCTCAGTVVDPCEAAGGDVDGDGVCAADDCDDNDASIPTAPGTACDDGDANTSSDVILADGCTCAGTVVDPCEAAGGDADGDGVCAADDCDDNDASIPTVPGTACDDGDANTSGDVILADGCTCQGTPSTGPDCANIVITPGNGSITVSGLAGVPITTIQVFNAVWAEVFNCAGNCDPVEQVITGLTPGTHFVKVGFYSATWSPICTTEDYYTVGAGDPCEAAGGDADGDGVCAVDDCDDNDASIPAAPGTACNDGDPDTTNDVILTDGCTCAGTPPGGDPCDNFGGDADGDGVCAFDDCDDNDASLPATPGTACDDGDANTSNDQIQADGCTCAGTPAGPDCANIAVTTGDGFITVSGLNGAPISTLQVFDQTWVEVFNCAGNCNGTEVITGLTDGTYFVKAVYYTPYWQPICSLEDFFTVVTGTGGSPCDNLGGDADGDGVCAANDCDDNDASLPAPVGSSCDDGNPNTTNDVILADGCGCAGTVPGSGPDCANVVLTPGVEMITISGLSDAPITTVQIFNAVWVEVFNCAGNCDPSEEVISGLTAGTYFVKVGFYNATWAPICSVEDYYTVAPSSDPLFRRLIEFTAQQGVRQVDLLWGTNTGSTNDHFVIERSANGIDYEPLLVRANEFGGTEAHLYEEADKDPIVGWNYYRLKQVHVNGSYVYTAERKVLFEQDVNEFTLFPNPVEEEVFVHLKSFSGESVSIEITNNLGQLVQQRQLDWAPNTPIGLDVSQLQAGVYAVSVKVDGKKRMTKLLVVSRK